MKNDKTQKKGDKLAGADYVLTVRQVLGVAAEKFLPDVAYGSDCKIVNLYLAGKGRPSEKMLAFAYQQGFGQELENAAKILRKFMKKHKQDSYVNEMVAYLLKRYKLPQKVSLVNP